jgi:hypothetical protein
MPDTHRTVEALPPAARRWRVGLLLLAVLLALLSLWALLHAPRALDAGRAGAYLLKLEHPTRRAGGA